MPPSARPPRILVIDDDPASAEAMAASLGRAGFDVATAAGGAAGLELAAAEPADLAIVDLLMPGMSGVDVCRRLRREHDLPIILVSDVDDELDVVLGLELGATDYLTKPLRMRELVARVNAILRRAGDGGGTESGGGRRRGGRAEPSTTEQIVRSHHPDAETVVEFSSVAVNLASREVSVKGTPVTLTRREFDLLALLLSPPNRVHTREELLGAIWPHHDRGAGRTLDTHVSRLRAKLSGDPDAVAAIVTVRGIGFRLDADAPARTRSR